MSDAVNRREVIAGLGLGLAALGLADRASALPPQMAMYYKDGKYTLPPLPYEYSALEPHIDEATMRLHHDKHHLAYVNGLNKALEALAAARKAGTYDAVKALSGDVAFHGSGHALHCLFWNSMRAAVGNPGPSAGLTGVLNTDFGSVDSFKAQFGAAAKAVEGSGWALLVLDPMSGKLLVTQAEKHQNLSFQGVVPMLALDVWEHAYYLKYQNNKPAYVDAWWNVVNWANLESMHQMVTKALGA